ncbi:MAG: PASTA domain-containing protein [Actinobacteria bacterium]|jgi:beta-lactam-binding protein with PASTA domain|nr:MAG: PASTA domain-containing protein [Actinomycetota bacterium]
MRRLMFSAAVFVALAMTAISFAAGRQLAVTPTSASQLPSTPLSLVVPDIRREAFVFAKGQLQDAGFAWRVVGGAPGYPANIVVSQSPAPGTKLIDTGSPLITITLERNKQSGGPQGEPENTSPYSPTPVRLAGTS